MEPPHEQGPVDVVEDRHRLDRVGSGPPGGVDAALPGEPLRDRYLVAQISARVEGGHERRRSFDHRSAGIGPLGWADRFHQAQGKVLVFERVRELMGQHQLQLPASLDRALDEDDPLVTVVVGGPDSLRGPLCCGIGGRLLGQDSRQSQEAGAGPLEPAGALEQPGPAAEMPDHDLVQPAAKRGELGDAHHADPRRALEVQAPNPLHPRGHLPHVERHPSTRRRARLLEPQPMLDRLGGLPAADRGHQGDPGSDRDHRDDRGSRESSGEPALVRRPP